MTWPVVTLNDLQANEPRAITDGPFGSNLASRHYTESGPRVVRLQNIGDGQFIDERAHISEEHFESLRAHEVRAGDLLVASLGEVLPRACLAPPALGPAIVKADCIRVRLGDAVDPRWVLYALQRPEVRRWADEHRHGVGRPRLGLKAIRQIPIPLPELEEQQRIVDLLEGHLSRLDAAEALVRKSIRRQAALRDAALYDWVQRARESAGVELATLGSIAKVTSGLTPLKANKAFYEGGTIPWITSGDLHQGVVTKASTFVTERALADTTLKMVPAGALLIAMYGEGKTRGTAAELGFDATTNQACAAVVLHDPNLRRWVRLVLDANYTRVRRLAAGGVQPNLNLSIIKAIEVPIPKADLRGELLAERRELDEQSRRLRADLAAAQSRGRSLRRSLLAAAFSGRLTTELPQPAESTLAV
ncbi:restriction endonuclease subunit S [Nocardioides perillae]|uniref:Type I restriction enzyme S subunit n=1 Tax=Nocardioides perillae TaxID=1119534 RepID=A0A7Y9ULH7_9ACTN|nr:restriction endonuclease subunit S [Nocardioides perillae]NYG54356.1 type I restriction enzyme S subunit [Nocardioides perillae]